MNQLPDAAALCACSWESGGNKEEAFNHTVQIWFMVSVEDKEGGSELNRNARRRVCAWRNMMAG